MKFCHSPVAPAAAAGDENHAGGGEKGHEEGVVICAADHEFLRCPELLRRLRGRIDDLT